MWYEKTNQGERDKFWNFESSTLPASKLKEESMNERILMTSRSWKGQVNILPYIVLKESAFANTDFRTPTS